VPVPSSQDASQDRPAPADLTFVLSVPTEASVAALQRGCLRLLGANVDFGDGSSAFITGSEGPFVAALRAEDERRVTSGVTSTPESGRDPRVPMADQERV
jgi:hypothetical protein